MACRRVAVPRKLRAPVPDKRSCREDRDRALPSLHDALMTAGLDEAVPSRRDRRGKSSLLKREFLSTYHSTPVLRREFRIKDYPVRRLVPDFLRVNRPCAIRGAQQMPGQGCRTVRENDHT